MPGKRKKPSKDPRKSAYQAYRDTYRYGQGQP